MNGPRTRLSTGRGRGRDAAAVATATASLSSLFLLARAPRESFIVRERGPGAPVGFLTQIKREDPMDRQRIEGGLERATGTIKEKTGEAIGSRHLEREGKAKRAEGRVRSGIGKAMDAVREVVNDEKD